MIKLAFLFIGLVGVTNLSAQVKGLVLDSATGKPIDRAVVALIVEANKSDTTFTLTDEKGEFVFETAPATNFSVRASNIGYKSSGKFRRIYGSEKKIDLGKITLVNQSIILDEIKIQALPIAVKEDTIEYRADAFKVKENGVVEDLLKKLPGVQVDKNGNVKAQGKAITKVKVNGKDFFGGDPRTATKELPANIVDKVQIVDDYGDQAAVSGIKDGDPEKVMNIQLKKNKNTGYFGRLTAGVGDKERYQASVTGNYFKEKQQISFFINSNNTSQSPFGGGSNKGAGAMSQNVAGAMGSQLNTPGNADMLLQSGSGSDGITT